MFHRKGPPNAELAKFVIKLRSLELLRGINQSWISHQQRLLMVIRTASLMAMKVSDIDELVDLQTHFIRTLDELFSAFRVMIDCVL